VVASRPDGGEVRLGTIAHIADGFQDSDYKQAFYNGQRAVRVKVFRVGEQSPVQVSDAARKYMDTVTLPPGIQIAIWNDTSEIFRDRIDLLMRNAYSGLVLVVICLALFLEIRLAFWVAMGIPVSFLGAMLLMPMLGVSINMITLFAFILTLGIVVDDAIVVSEAVYNRRQSGLPRLQAAILGIKDVAVPVVFSVLTTVVAFMPMLFIPGTTGKFFGVIPLIVIPILLMSLAESLFTLPAHLAEMGEGGWGPLGWIVKAQQWFSRVFERAIEFLYQPFARFAINWRYVTLAIALGTALVTFGYAGSGRLKFTFLPQVEGDTVTVGVRLPFGAPIENTQAIQARILQAGKEVLEEYGGEAGLSRGLYSEVGYARPTGGAGMTGPMVGSHITQVALFLVPVDKRSFTSAEFAKKWREKLGDVAGIETLTFAFTTGFQAGSPIDLQLSHPDAATLEVVAAELAESLKTYAGVFGVDNGLMRGKSQIDLELRPAARALGITELDLARQVRGHFFGLEAVRQQRGRDELRVFVRRPLSERQSEYSIDNLKIRTPTGGEIPLDQAAVLDRGRAYTEIKRINGRRVLNVTSDVDIGVTTPGEVLTKVDAEVLPKLVEKYPGLTSKRGGEQQAQAESLGALRIGFGMALLGMYGLMALAFRSYVQPIIVMVAIPFGVVGALLGHIGLGYSLSFMSIMGMIALAGVVVNDSIVMVDAINEFRKNGMTTSEAVVAASTRRFRPILLTSLTTFLGLMPMIFETSVQARFLIPMAVGLGFGVLFTTPVALLVVPSIYMMIEDITRILRGFHWLVIGPSEPEHAHAPLEEEVIVPPTTDTTPAQVEPDPTPEPLQNPENTVTAAPSGAS
jgi:multidrug efflux pump subunit AcrB